MEKLFLAGDWKNDCDLLKLEQTVTVERCSAPLDWFSSTMEQNRFFSGQENQQGISLHNNVDCQIAKAEIKLS